MYEGVEYSDELGVLCVGEEPSELLELLGFERSRLLVSGEVDGESEEVEGFVT